jgi:hypothetical protein
MTGQGFENHLVFDKLEQFKNRLTEVEIRESIGINDLNFFETAYKYLIDRLKLTIPTIVQESELTTISQEIENSLSQINTFVGNKNSGHLTNAKTHLHSAITRVRNLPLPFSKSDFNFSKNIANFEKIVQEKYEVLENENEGLKKDLENLNTELDANRTELKRISALLEQKETEIQNLNSSFQIEFTNIKSTANQNYDFDRKTFRTEFDNIKQTLNSEIEEIKQSIDNDTSELIEKLDKKLDEAKKIVGVIGDVSVTGNYQQVANDNKKTADQLRCIAIALMLLLSILLIYSIWDISGSTFDWTKSLIRILAAAALSYPATYASRESNKHRRLEILNRKAELELSAINPFIELLPENTKQEIKEKLVEKYFGNNSNILADTDCQKEDDPISAVDRILKTILPYLTKK